MSTHKTKILLWLMALSLILACVPSFAAPSVATPLPGAVNTFIAQTANAAQTETAAALPTSTPTATLTPTPSNTETPSPTETPTVIFILSSPTSPPTFTPVSLGGGSSSGGGGSSGGGSSSSSFACQVLSVTPANGTPFNARDDFDAVWRVRNTGRRTWERTSVDYIYLSGDQFHKVSGYDFKTNVAPGETVNLTVDMKAPKTLGTYSTRWTLRVGSENFCTMSLTIVVK